MPQAHASVTSKARLDEVLARIGVTREQLNGMSAKELFAAATRWQNVVTMAATARRGPSALDRLIASLPVPPASSAKWN